MLELTIFAGSHGRNVNLTAGMKKRLKGFDAVIVEEALASRSYYEKVMKLRKEALANPELRSKLVRQFKLLAETTSERFGANLQAFLLEHCIPSGSLEVIDDQELERFDHIPTQREELMKDMRWHYMQGNVQDAIYAARRYFNMDLNGAKVRENAFHQNLGVLEQELARHYPHLGKIGRPLRVAYLLGGAHTWAGRVKKNPDVHVTEERSEPIEHMPILNQTMNELESHQKEIEDVTQDKKRLLFACLELELISTYGRKGKVHPVGPQWKQLYDSTTLEELEELSRRIPRNPETIRKFLERKKIDLYCK